jgi:putative tryptophan/tyrosine transport system substrate-binding protein
MSTRREFITLLGAAAAAWPKATGAQQPTLPLIGFLSSLRATDEPLILTAFRRGLEDEGYFESRNVALEYRWAAGRFEQLPALAAELVRRQVAVIAAISGTPSALAAKAATRTIPIVFAMGSDPIDQGLVVSLNRPGGNITGATFFTAALGPKRLGLLRELVVNAKAFVLLVNPDNPASTLDTANVLAAARALGQTVKVMEAVTGGDIDAAFVVLSRDRPDALYIDPDPLFFNQRDRLAVLSARYALPAIYGDREIVQAGGLISYGASRTDAYRQAGVYAGRMLKGERAEGLPVVLPTRFELVINLKTAKALGLEIPTTLLARADEVIE